MKKWIQSYMSLSAFDTHANLFKLISVVLSIIGCCTCKQKVPTKSLKKLQTKQYNNQKQNINSINNLQIQIHTTLQQIIKDLEIIHFLSTIQQSLINQPQAQKNTTTRMFIQIIQDFFHKRQPIDLYKNSYSNTNINQSEVTLCQFLKLEMSKVLAYIGRFKYYHIRVRLGGPKKVSPSTYVILMHSITSLGCFYIQLQN
eukprot:TRINITY_DN3339_c0_g1_i3.p7 TRINITY_DN3339_c0_g1~~TRINITY_DN3339_c0_g1_i3.p7  ORF type:complete len:200 (+),score=-13.73 TRINITY_DN3339_c0_g1_i3:2533-3132(+)